ncbi:MAG TPA: hypothetical protein VFS43_40765 [Polyangiaceae bacterium]|nr:hypothetical protein [Polyangiaceae bacterium]
MGAALTPPAPPVAAAPAAVPPRHFAVCEALAHDFGGEGLAVRTSTAEYCLIHAPARYPEALADLVELLGAEAQTATVLGRAHDGGDFDAGEVARRFGEALSLVGAEIARVRSSRAGAGS